MVRGAQYLSIDTKTKFIETLVAKIQGGCCPLVRRVTKNMLVRRGLKSENKKGHVEILK